MRLWRADDVGEGGLLDGLVLGGEASVVLALVFLPAGDLELLDEQVAGPPRPGTGPSGWRRSGAGSGAWTPSPRGRRPAGRRWTSYWIDTMTGLVRLGFEGEPWRCPSTPAGNGRGPGCRAPAGPGPPAVLTPSRAAQPAGRRAARAAAVTSPQSGAATAWVPRNTISRIAMARARTQPGRNSCSSEVIVATVDVQPNPHTTSSGIATHSELGEREGREGERRTGAAARARMLFEIRCCLTRRRVRGRRPRRRRRGRRTAARSRSRPARAGGSRSAGAAPTPRRRGTTKVTNRSRIVRTTGSWRTYRPPARSAGRNRSRSPRSAARAAPQQQDDGQEGGGGGVQREHRRDTPGGDDEPGDRRAGGSGDVDADHVEPGRGGELVARHQLGDQRLPGRGSSSPCRRRRRTRRRAAARAASCRRR